MSDKIKIFIIAVILLIIVIFIFNNSKSKNSDTENVTEVVSIDENKIEYNDTTGEYYITDENGEVLHSGYNKEDLGIYTIDPDYEPWVTEENDSENILVEEY